MKIEQKFYQNLNIGENHIFSDIFTFNNNLRKFVTFSPNMKLPFHRWFYYKPGFSCDLVNFLKIRHFGNDTPPLKIFDPFSGVGTTALWAYENGHYGVGSDISPLPIFISKCKSIRNVNESSLLFDAKKIINLSNNLKEKDIENESIPYYFEKGFDKKTKVRLIELIKNINLLENVENKNILLLVLMKAAYDVSFTKKDGGFIRYIDEKRFKNIEDRIMLHLTDIIRDFKIQSLKNFGHQKNNIKPKFYMMDSRELKFPKNSFDFVVTSPPYLNRYDYTRIYAIELGILGIFGDELKLLRKRTLKSHVEADYKKCEKLKSDIFRISYDKLISSKLSNPQIPEMVNGYYNDLASTLIQLKKVVKEGGIVSFIVGNSRFSGIHFETDSILSEIAQNLDFEVKEIIVTKLRGSSAQQVRTYGDSQLRESVVTFQV